MDTDVVSIPLTKGYVAFIDSADYKQLFMCEFQDGLFWAGRVCDREWYASVKPHTVYVVCKVAQIEMRLHRLLMCARYGELIDHHDRNGLNCRRVNLRRASDNGNAQNRLPSTGRDFPKGVSFHKQTGRFEAYTPLA